MMYPNIATVTLSVWQIRWNKNISMIIKQNKCHEQYARVIPITNSQRYIRPRPFLNEHALVMQKNTPMFENIIFRIIGCTPFCGQYKIPNKPDFRHVNVNSYTEPAETNNAQYGCLVISNTTIYVFITPGWTYISQLSAKEAIEFDGSGAYYYVI